MKNFHDHASSFSEGERRCCRHRHRLLRLRKPRSAAPSTARRFPVRDFIRCGPRRKNSACRLKKAPTEYLRQIYFDSLIFTPEAIRHLVAQAGASQVMLGTDYPYPWEMDPVDPILATVSLSDDDKADILGRTAAKLFNVQA